MLEHRASSARSDFSNISLAHDTSIPRHRLLTEEAAEGAGTTCAAIQMLMSVRHHPHLAHIVSTTSLSRLLYKEVRNIPPLSHDLEPHHSFKLGNTKPKLPLPRRCMIPILRRLRPRRSIFTSIRKLRIHLLHPFVLFNSSLDTL